MRSDDNRLDPELLPVILEQRQRNANRPPMGSLPPEKMRARALAEFEAWNADPPYVAKTIDFNTSPSSGHVTIPVRLYDPTPDQAGGCLIYFHGGGWVVGDLELEDAGLRRMALAGPVKILSVDYRLAPEHPFPAAVEDGESVVRWLVQEAPKDLMIDPSRLAIGGASAGANIAIGTALRLRDAARPTMRSMILLYGAYGGGVAMASHKEFGDGRFGLPHAAMEFFWHAYLGDNRKHPHAVPLAADLQNLPPAFLVKAELDILADETDALAKRLLSAGVSAEVRCYPGSVHGFTQYAKVSALARAALEEAGRMAAAALG